MFIWVLFILCLVYLLKNKNTLDARIDHHDIDDIEN